LINFLEGRAKERTAFTLVIVQFSLLALLAILGIANLKAKSHQYLVAEVVMGVVGVAVISSAAFSLKPSLRVSPIPKINAPMIQSGIYSRVRHPMYLGVILIGASFAGFANTTLAWILEILLIADLNVKARFEDALLRAEHPESMHYQLHVSRIMPCLGGSCRSNCLYKSGEA
jgi:protein-S-isoprenylcysteine O-methyltransferase Ste14